jgi:ABC-type branched-subunit amino acid transport system substrate-binding protein
MPDDNKLQRRTFLKASGAVGGTFTLAGCVSGIGGGGGGPISMGSILPITGALSQFGGGMQEAVNMAVEDINNAGGILGGREFEVSNKDSGTKPATAQQKYSSLVEEDEIVGFVGAASSGVSVPLAQKVAADEVMQVSNASTTPSLAEIGYGDDGEPPKYFARTAPNDGQQGIVMGQIMNSDEFIGADSAAFLHVANSYGKGLAEKASDAFGGETLQTVSYASQTSDYTSTLDKLHQGDPDAIGFVGYPGNGKTILKQWSQGGYNTEASDWVLSEGLNSDDFLSANSGIVSDMYLASPDPESTDGASTFQEKMGEANTLFAPHAYDGMVLMALAMQKADEASATAVAENIRSVSRGSGMEVTVGELETAFDELSNGNDVNYQGASSPVDLNESLEPLNRFAILQIQGDGSKKSLKQIPRSEFEGQL